MDLQKAQFCIILVSTRMMQITLKKQIKEVHYANSKYY